MPGREINFNVADFQAALAQFQQVLDSNAGASPQEILAAIASARTQATANQVTQKEENGTR